MSDLETSLVRLAGALRHEGLGTTLGDAIDAGRALSLVDREDRDEVRRALLIALKIPRDAYELFDRCLPIFYGEAARRPPPQRARHRIPGLPRGRLLSWDPVRRRMGGAGEAGAEKEGKEPAYSSAVQLRAKAFSDTDWSPRELSRMERMLELLARRLPVRQSRRLIPARGRGSADLRSSLRGALRTSGELLILARRSRAFQRPKLVFLCDTSGSMENHTRFLLSFIIALRRVAPGTELFVFNTELVRVTALVVPGKVALSLERMARAAGDWSGGTRIGASLAAFVGDYSRLVDAKTDVIIVSDGLDRGEPERIAGALSRLGQRARKVIWLNPLSGDPSYEPLARGMQVALPFVDHFASAHDLASLERLIAVLG